jgi:hypothetical protein
MLDETTSAPALVPLTPPPLVPVQRHEHHHHVVVEMRGANGSLDDDTRREMLRRFERELRPLVGTDAETVARKLALIVMAMLETE